MDTLSYNIPADESNGASDSLRPAKNTDTETACAIDSTKILKRKNQLTEKYEVGHAGKSTVLWAMNKKRVVIL
jgi:hypothetical protein